MASTDRQPIRKAPPGGAILLLTNGTVCTMVRPGREAPPMTMLIRQKEGPELEIPLTEVAEVMWSP